MKYWRLWKWFRVSPLLIVTFLLVMPLLVEDETLSVIITFSWFSTAVVSSILADLVRRKTKEPLYAAREELDADDPLRENVESNHTVAVMTEIVHAAFACVGAIVIFPFNIPWVATGTRDLLLFGQYVLFLVVLRLWVSHERIEEKVYAKVEASSGKTPKA